MELMKEQKQMVFSGNDPNLPGWFTTCINGLAKKELTLLLEDTWVDISGNPAVSYTHLHSIIVGCDPLD